MASKRRGSSYTPSSRLNFRPSNAESARFEAKGTKPLRERSSISDVLVTMLLHICRRVMFFDIRKRVLGYLGCLFIISLVVDVAPIPRSYFSRTDNFLNQYFVKLGWAWTLTAATPFVAFTSYTVSCGQRSQVIQHMSRMAVATAVWFFCTSLFAYIEAAYGRCNDKSGFPKKQCLAKGSKWQTFDISGHTFILMYSTLLLIEEGRAIIGWERIRDLIRDEHHTRSNTEESTTNALSGLNESEFNFLVNNYDKVTPWVKVLFVFMTALSILWDIMLLATMLYFHNMGEKFLSGLIASFMWYATYQGWFSIPSSIPGLPGEGVFKYKETKSTSESLVKKRIVSQQKVPSFMGRPLTALRNQDVDVKDNGVYLSGTSENL